MEKIHYIALIKVTLSSLSILIAFCYLLDKINLLQPVKVAADLIFTFYIFLLIAFVYFPKDEYKTHIYKLFGFKKVLNPLADLINFIIEPTNSFYINIYIGIGIVAFLFILIIQILNYKKKL